MSGRRTAFCSALRKVVNHYTGNQFGPICQSVLIPEGAEADLARLRHELSTRFPALPIALA